MRKQLAAIALALAVVATPSVAAAAPGDDTELDPDLLEAKLEAFAAFGDHSVVAEVRDGDQTWNGAIGPRGIGGDVDVETDDRVRIASLTKSMVATVLLQLEDEGAVDLDQRLGDHLPGLLPYEDEPTIRQLMQHTGGLPDYFPSLYPSLMDNDISDVREGYQDHYEPAELVEMGTGDPLLFEPGTDWSYSNTAYMGLGLLIEELTGNSVGYELESRVFEPAGMDDAYFPHDDSYGLRGPHPDAYLTSGESDDPYFDTSELSNTQMWAAGGVIADLDDVNAFYRAAADGTLLSAEQFADATDWVDTGDGNPYGLGFLGLQLGCPDDPDEVFVGHTGGGLGHQTYSFHSADGERQMTFTWNVDDRHGYGDPEESDVAFAGLLVASLCGVDLDEDTDLRAQDLPDFAKLDELTSMG